MMYTISMIFFGIFKTLKYDFRIFKEGVHLARPPFVHSCSICFVHIPWFSLDKCRLSRKANEYLMECVLFLY
jgi:hypothetical protein